MSNPSLAPIKNRLAGTAQYKPFSAETFADWASEAGDTVQISRDGTTYSAPIHKQTISWHGAHKVTMESGGTKDREAMQRTSNRKYRNSSAGVSSEKAARKKIQYDFYDNNGALHSMISMTAQSLTTQFQNADAGLQSQITQEAGRISLVVEGTGANAHIKPASIVAAINGQSGSYVQISADKINLDGYVTLDELEGDTVILSKLSVGGPIFCQYIGSAEQQVATGYFGTIYLGGEPVTDCIVDASVNSSTGVVTLTYASGDTFSFNRATPSTVTLSPSWSGNVFTVAASNPTITPIAETFSTEKGAGDGGSVGGLVTIDSYSSAHKGYAYVKATRIGSGNGVLYRVVADASNVYTEGYNSARISAITWGGTAGNVGHVEISTSGATSRDFTVRATAVGVTYDSASHKYTGNVQALVSGTERHSVAYDSGTEAYEDGWENCHDAFSWPAPKQTGASIQMTIPGSTPSSATQSRSYTMSISDGAALLTRNNEQYAVFPLPATANWSSYWPAQNVISVTCNVGGKSYTQSFTRP